MWEMMTLSWSIGSVAWIIAITAAAIVIWVVHCTFIERRRFEDLGFEDVLRLLAWERSDRQAKILERGWMTRWQWYWMRRRIYRSVAAELGYKPPALIELRTKAACHVFVLKNRLRSSS